jgi:hypothetical protein
LSGVHIEVHDQSHRPKRPTAQASLHGSLSGATNPLTVLAEGQAAVDIAVQGHGGGPHVRPIGVIGAAGAALGPQERERAGRIAELGRLPLLELHGAAKIGDAELGALG